MSKAKKGTKMSLGSFLTDESLGKWADDVEDLPSAPATREMTHDDHPSGGYQDRSTLRDDRREREPFRPKLPVPDRPPYTAYLGNLNFETTEHDINLLFRDLRINNIRLIRGLNEKPKGFGYVEFGDKDSLEEALKYDNESVCGRRIKINVAEAPKDGRPPREESRSDGEWRRDDFRPLSPVRDSGFRGDRDGGFRGDRDGGFRGDRDGGFRGDRDGGSRDRGRFGQRGGRDREFVREQPVQRKKLELLPKTTSAESSPVTSPVTNKGNPFGAAKPRDDAEFERRFEERQRQKQEEAAARKAEEEKRRKEQEEEEERRRQEKVERRPSRGTDSKRGGKAPAPSRAEVVDDWRRDGPVELAPPKAPKDFKAGGMAGDRKRPDRNEGRGPWKDNARPDNRRRDEPARKPQVKETAEPASVHKNAFELLNEDN